MRVVETFIISMCEVWRVLYILSENNSSSHRSSVPAVDVHISQVSNNEFLVCAVITVNQKLSLLETQFGQVFYSWICVMSGIILKCTLKGEELQHLDGGWPEGLQGPE